MARINASEKGGDLLGAASQTAEREADPLATRAESMSEDTTCQVQISAAVSERARIGIRRRRLNPLP
jgi:hypothetical protein